MELKDYDLRCIPIVLLSWILIIWMIISLDFFHGDISQITAFILLGFLWSLPFVFDNWPLYRYVIDERGIQVFCILGEIGTISWENIVFVGISPWGRMSSALYVSVAPPYQLKILHSHRKEFGLLTSSLNANSLLWRKGFNALSLDRPLLILKRDTKLRCIQYLKQLEEIYNFYSKSY